MSVYRISNIVYRSEATSTATYNLQPSTFANLRKELPVLTYKFTARNPATGEKVTSIIQAPNEKAAGKLIHEQGLSPARG
jgi:hypothetical protein